MLSVGLSQAFFGSSHLLGVKIFPDLLNLLGFSGTFFFYTGICLFMTLWAVVFMTSHDNLSLVEVETMFEKKKGEAIKKMANIAIVTTK